MSRCFPFPPPGYEKKIRTEEADSLIKEKHKEKKHKKEKKDKERKEGKEGKEKKEKETSKDKHKERKEKKEKRKDRKDKDRDREKTRTSEDKKSAGVLPNTGDKEKLNNGNGESKFIQDLARRIRDEEEATESQSSHDYLTKSKISCPVTQTNHTKVDEKSINTHKNSALERRPESAFLRVSSSMDQKGAEVTVKPLEKKELQEKNHRRKNVAKSDKSLDRSEPKNITDRSSKEKKEEKTEVINKTVQEKQKFLERGPRLKEKGNDSVDARIFGVQDLSRAGVKNLTAGAVPGKRKDLETNGFLYENGSRPNKIQRPNASPKSFVENGRKLGASQTPPKPISELQGTVCNPEVKEQRINGFIYPREPKSHPQVSSVKVKENSETSAKKRPHSDLEYLDQILNVPKREELREVDDVQQEWLFGQSGVKLLKKQRADSATSLVETPQVWNQALRIETADIVALPYVVPF